MILKRLVLLIAAFVLAFFGDASLSSFFSGLSGYELIFSSYLLLVVLFYASVSRSTIFLYPILIVLGIFYDAYYFGTLGLSVWLFPVFLYVLRHSLRYRKGGRLEQFLLLLALSVIFSTITYALGLVYGVTTYPVHLFMARNFLPSLVLNALYILMLQRIMNRFLR